MLDRPQAGVDSQRPVAGRQGRLGLGVLDPAKALDEPARDRQFTSRPEQGRNLSWCGRHPPARLRRTCADLDSGIASCPGPLTQGEPILQRGEAGLAAGADPVPLERPLRLRVAGRPGGLKSPLRVLDPRARVVGLASLAPGTGQSHAGRIQVIAAAHLDQRRVAQLPGLHEPELLVQQARQRLARLGEPGPPAGVTGVARGARGLDRLAEGADGLVRATDRREGAAQVREAPAPVRRLIPAGDAGRAPVEVGGGRGGPVGEGAVAGSLEPQRPPRRRIRRG